jgi:hypothetical protein
MSSRATEIVGSIGLLSAIIGIGSGVGVVGSGLAVQYLSWHWLFSLPFAITVVANGAHVALRPGVPRTSTQSSQVRAAVLMAVGISAVYARGE